ncbi:MAG: ABC-type transport auxiliary lipoprotein family protein [Acidobacteriota bacterium]|nr:ABC-type transport auxiliary lipoprotein family protein [Acidobacteriota bacterium]
MRPRLQLIVMLCWLTACASAPKISYYTLAMDPSGTVDASVNLAVEQVRTTDALSRNRIMIQASPTKIEYYATDQWAGGLAELVRQKLTAEFGQPVEGRRTLAVTAVVLSCEQVDAVAGAEARMKMSVTVRDPSKKRYHEPLLEKTYEATRPSARASAGAVVEALSLCAEQIAGEIAADAGALRTES